MTQLEQITCIAIIIAMLVIVIKAFSYPLENLFRAINPFAHYRMWQSLNSRIDEQYSEIFDLKNQIKELKKDKKRK